MIYSYNGIIFRHANEQLIATHNTDFTNNIQEKKQTQRHIPNGSVQIKFKTRSKVRIVVTFGWEVSIYMGIQRGLLGC